MSRTILILSLCLAGAALPALAVPTTPTSDFTDNGNGTVTHRKTGLTWMRCSQGQAWSGSGCSGSAQTYRWANATALTASYAGNSDWRLPSIAELHSLIEFDGNTINSTLFPDTPPLDYWSATPYAGDTVNAWSFNYGLGYGTYASYKESLFAVRLVRGKSFSAAAAYTPTTDFTDNADGTVTHKRSGLTWKRCAEGQSWTGSTCSGTPTSYTWSNAVALTSTSAGYSDWRLPAWNELETLVEYGATGPAINLTVFPGTASARYWSSTASSRFTDYAWFIFFGDGSGFYNDKRYQSYVRLVRGSQNVVSPSSDADRVFAWAERTYAPYFAPGGVATATAGGYTYRYYSTSNCILAIKDGQLWYYGPLSGYQVLPLGSSDYFLGLANATP